MLELLIHISLLASAKPAPLEMYTFLPTPRTSQTLSLSHCKAIASNVKDKVINVISLE